MKWALSGVQPAEDLAVARDILLAEMTDSGHIPTHVSK